MHTGQPTPSKEEIALLEPFERLGLNRIELVSTLAQAEVALAELPSWTLRGDGLAIVRACEQTSCDAVQRRDP